MFRHRNNIVKKAGKKLTPDKNKLGSIFQDFFTNPASEQKHQNRKRNESYYRDKLAKSLNGQIEVQVPTGRIDILTNNQIIEVKHIKRWKGALGQIIVYGDYYPNHQKRIHLFGENDDAQTLLIVQQCQKQNVIATFEMS